MIPLIEQALPVLVQGFWVTLRIGLFAILFGSLLGLGAALMRLSSHRSVSWLAFAYSTVFRGTPLLIQLFLLYYGIGTLEAVRHPRTHAARTTRFRILARRSSCLPSCDRPSTEWTRRRGHSQRSPSDRRALARSG